MKTATRTLTRRHSARLDEERYEATLDCGIRLLFAPRRGFNKKLAFVTAGYGSVDRAWRENGTRREIPDGIAHFLEHMMFKKERGDLTDEFSARGAYVNAHTGHTATSYYFECVENFEQNLATLLELVLTPWFTNELVATECEIIVQEIMQYRDQPGWVGYQQLLEALYVKNPLRVDIAGDEESVRTVTPELLSLCHRSFYDPRNLTLVVAGDINAGDLLRTADELASRFAPVGNGRKIVRERPTEPMRVTRRRAERRMFLSRPRLLLGFKDRDGLRGRELARRDALTGIALDALFSREGEAWERLYSQHLISSDFGAGYQSEPGFGYAVVGGETQDPVRLEEELLKEVARARKAGIDPEAIERKRRKFLGHFLRAFNEPESTAYSYLSALSQGIDLFELPALVDGITVEEVNARVKELLQPSRCAASVLYPMA